jgi:hypothetical protein
MHTHRGCVVRGLPFLSLGDLVLGVVMYISHLACCACRSCESDCRDVCKISELGTTARRPFSSVENDRPQYLGFRCRCCRYLSIHSPSVQIPCFRCQADSSSIVMPNPSSELHLRSCITVPLNDTLLFLPNSVCFHERRNSSQILCHTSCYLLVSTRARTSAKSVYHSRPDEVPFC